MMISTNSMDMIIDVDKMNESVIQIDDKHEIM